MITNRYPKLKKMTANEILKKYEDAREIHFHEVDRKWIIEAMEEYAWIQIEKDRSEKKRLMNEKLKDFEGLNPEIEAIIDREINLD